MHTTALPVFASVLGIVAAAGCGRSAVAPAPATSADADKLAALGERVDDLDGRLSRIEALLRQALDPPDEPDGSATYSVPVDGDPFEGPADAKVTVVKAFEFACGFCYRARPTVAEMLARYRGDVRVVYKYFVVHDQAVAPGLAVCAAHQQGKFSEMKDLIWDKGFAERDIGEDRMKTLALELGLDTARFARDIAADGPCMDWLKRGYTTMSRLGVRGTPAWFVNGRFVSGAQPLPTFTALIDEELAKVNRAMDGGTSAADYYRKHVVDDGIKELP